MLVSVGKTVQEPGWIYHWMEEGKLRVQNTFLITLNKIYYIVYVSYFIYRGRDEKKKRQEFLKQRALSSIKVFALQRVPLVIDREKKAILISAQMQRVEEALFNFNDFSDDPVRAERFSKILRREIEALQSFLNPEEEFLGLARQMIGSFLKKNFQIDINAA